MTKLEQREECLRNHPENNPFPGVGCAPEPKSALARDPGSIVGQNRRRICLTLVGQGRSVHKASWDRRVRTEIPA